MIEISDNTLYYTLSTVAQSIAAAIAFLGAFVLFKIQALAGKIELSLTAIASQTTQGGATSGMVMLVRAGQYQKALSQVKVDPQSMGEAFQTSYNAVTHSIKSIENTKTKFKIVLYASIVMISLSFMGLSFVDILKCSQYIYFYLISYVLISVFVLAYMAYIIQEMIND